MATLLVVSDASRAPRLPPATAAGVAGLFDRGSEAPGLSSQRTA
ncbi:hypothetical protein [Frankia sp. QA3]|nr:hypothetical protein [Frankia sp. QA3]